MDQQLALKLFNYVDGELYWNKTGKLAGWTSREGYRKVGYYGSHSVHRIIFLMFNGYLPELVDHKDRNKLNNKIENLRDISFQENILNQKVNSTSKSKIKNISWHKATNKWRVQICRNYKVMDIGYFKCLGEAIRARAEFKEA